MKKRWWILIGLGVVLIGTPIVGPEMWARSWEKRWEEFRTEWEAKGEDLGVESHLPAPVPDEENFAAHPLLLRMIGDGEDLGPWLDDMSVVRVDGYIEADSNGDHLGVVAALQGDSGLRQRLHAHLAEFESEIDAFAGAAARPSMITKANLNDGIGGGRLPWLGCGHFANFLRVQIQLGIAEKDEPSVVSGVETLILLGNHIRNDRWMNGLLIGVGTDGLVCSMIDLALDANSLGPKSKRRLVELLEEPRPSNGEALAAVLRFERGIWLREAERMEAGVSNVGLSRTRHGLVAWLPKKAVERVFFARNRLGICEDMQTCLLAPDGVVRTDIRTRDLPRYDKALDVRYAEEDVMDALAIIAMPNVRTTSIRLEKLEARRLEILERLRE